MHPRSDDVTAEDILETEIESSIQHKGFNSYLIKDVTELLPSLELDRENIEYNHVIAVQIPDTDYFYLVLSDQDLNPFDKNEIENYENQESCVHCPAISTHTLTFWWTKLDLFTVQQTCNECHRKLIQTAQKHTEQEYEKILSYNL